MDGVVVGAGVIGLSVAVRLVEAGHDVRVWARDLPHDTTSGVAGAIWYPYRAAPADRLLGWGRRSLEVFGRLAGDPATGVVMRHGTEVFRRPTPDPWWRDAVPDFARADPAALPPGYRDGYALELPVIVMPRYLDWLQERLAAAGGQVVQRTVERLDQVGAEVVIDCAGLGARDLAGDAALVPVRGQVVIVRNPGLERFWIDDEDPAAITYVIPRGDDCVLGGTAEEGNWSLEPDVDTAMAILERCRRLEPRLLGAEILAHRVGLRPARPEVRLEADTAPDSTRIVHCYGHGGAGVTLSWGCADEVAGLVGAA